MPADLIDELRCLLVSALRLQRDPQTIDPHAELFGGDLGLDSLDAVQLVTAIEKHFAVEISDHDLARSALATIATIAALLREKGCHG
jgi:acyl carrier protein